MKTCWGTIILVGPGGPFFITHFTLPNQFAHTRTHKHTYTECWTSDSYGEQKTSGRIHFEISSYIEIGAGGVQANTGISTPQAQIFKLKSEIANYFGFKLKSLLISIMTRGLSRYSSHGLWHGMLLGSRIRSRDLLLESWIATKTGTSGRLPFH